MFPSRTTSRAARAIRTSTAQNAVKRSTRRQYATQQEASSSSSSGGGGIGPGIAGGVIGGSAVFAATYVWYSYSGAKSVVATGQQVKSYADSAADQLRIQFKEMTPGDSDDVLGAIKDTAQKYAGWIPGGREFVDSSFKDLDAIKAKHGNEVNEIAKATYEELREVGNKKGASLETLTEVWQILSKRLNELTALAGDASQQILDNHPQLKEKVGGSFDQLKQMGDKLGPEAKKQVDDTFKEVTKIVSAGFSADSFSRVQKLVEEKTQELKKLGEQSWQAGYEQIKPQLDKNPQVKEFVETNMDTLKNGHVTEVLEKVRTAVTSGNTDSLKRYADDLKNKADSYTGGGISKWLHSLPNGSQIFPQLLKLKEAAESKGPEAQDLAKKTIADIQKIVEERAQEAEKLLKK